MTEMSKYATEQLSRLLGRLVFVAHAAARNHDEESIHDLRVAIRRLLQGLRTFRQFLPRQEVKKIRKRLNSMIHAAAVVRDRDIALAFLHEPGTGQVAALCAALESERKDAQNRLVELLQHWESRNTSSRWRSRLRLSSLR